MKNYQRQLQVDDGGRAGCGKRVIGIGSNIYSDGIITGKKIITLSAPQTIDTKKRTHQPAQSNSSKSLKLYSVLFIILMFKIYDIYI